MKLIVIALCVAVACAEEYRAVVLLQGGGNYVNGNITFKQLDDGPVMISGTVTGLTAGQHGFHIHEKGDISGGCMSTLGHFNPHKVAHGGPTDEVRHVGDLGNIYADSKGVAQVSITDDVITLCHGSNSIIGRALVIHSGVDDLGKGPHTDSLTTGHAGSRVTCGVIGIQSPTGSWSKNSASSSAAVGVFTAVTALSVTLLRI